MDEAVARAEAHSPYLRLLMRRFPHVVCATKLNLANAQVATDMPVAKALRIAKGELALRVALGDLSGTMSLDCVMTGLSDFADTALDQAIIAAFAAVVPGAPVEGFAVVALGKHGSRELNYSSDLDPILIFDPAVMPLRLRDEPIETAIRIGRKLIEIMQARDGNGYVFRIDMRLRPNPEITPIVLPVDAAIAYYESTALAWERAAFIRARACAGDTALGNRFLSTIQPFIWRRGLDFGAIKEIRGISSRIRSAYEAGQAFGPGFDLKRGRGGIRECEFFAQIHQMIHGGRDLNVRAPATQTALKVLAEAGWIESKDSVTLIAAYRLYRTIEHRLQMVDDLQTHQLPVNGIALDNVAMLHGLESANELLSLLRAPVAAVGEIYDRLDGGARLAMPRNSSALAAALEQVGMPNGSAIGSHITRWRSGSYRALRSSAAQDAFEAVLPAILSAISAAPDPVMAVTRFDQMIERLPSIVNLFRLLDARPHLLSVLMNILCHAPTLAAEVGRRADLLDGLIDATAFEPAGTVDMIAQRLRCSGDIEMQFDALRRVVGEMRFALGVQIIEGICDPLDAASGYARIAEAAIGVVADAVIEDFTRIHGRVDGSELAILALGRLGGAALTHASDLDLVYVFTGDFRAESDGSKPLGAVLYYNRLAQRITAGLSVPTAAGALYEIDTRLRPSGAKGPLSVSLEGFAQYQRDNAWTWEQMALTRARVVYGSSAARRDIALVIESLLQRPRDRARVTADAIKMRADIAQHKPAKSPLDIKLGAGGLVDLEFTVHVTQLSNTRGFDPRLRHAILALGFDQKLADAHDLLTRFLVVMRLVAPEFAEPARATHALVARACGVQTWKQLLAELTAARQCVEQAWLQIKGE